MVYNGEWVKYGVVCDGEWVEYDVINNGEVVMVWFITGSG